MAGVRAICALAVLVAGPVSAQPVASGTDTHGGAVAGASVVHVTSLADSGPGSLRAAFQATGPKVIVFDVGGIIHLESDLKLSTSRTTVAGQTAPGPGITLTGGSLRLRANDLEVSHIAVRPGPAATAAINGNRDSITIGGGDHPLHDIRIENVSLSWSVDENADIAGGTQNVTFRNSIIAEALRNAGHPKGRHSMGMLINKDNQGVAVTGNLFASNMFRNPVIARGSSAFVGYNLIVNPAENAIHFYDVAAATPLKASIVGNVVTPGPDTASNVTAVQIPDDMAQKNSDAEIYLSDNQAPAGLVTNKGGFGLAGQPPVAPPEADAPPADVRAWVSRYAGARPLARGTVDARIVSGKTRIIDSPADGLDDVAPVQTAAEVPAEPFAPSDKANLLRIEVWLCRKHLELGGPATPQCPAALAQDGVQISQRR